MYQWRKSLATGWTEVEMRRVVRYYSRLVWFEHIPFEEFEYLEFKREQGVLL